MQVDSIKTRGLKTSWIHAGRSSEPIIIFLHGFPDDASVWQHQINFFKSGYEVIAPDIRGVGASESTSMLQRYNPFSVALDHLEILRHVDNEPNRSVYVVGHDLGGVHAFVLAQLLGERLKGLILINTMEMNQMFRRLKNPQQLRKSWYIFFMQCPFIPEWCSRFLDKPENARFALNQYRAFLRSSQRYNKFSKSTINAPILVIWGLNDPYLVPPTKEEFEGYAPNVIIRMLNTSHWPQRDQPDIVNQLIGQFIGENP